MKIKYYVILAVLLIIDVLFIIKNKQIIINNKKLQSELKVYKSEVSKINDDKLLSLNVNDIVMPDILIKSYQDTNIVCGLKELIQEPTLIVFIPFNEFTCMSCVDFSLGKAKSCNAVKTGKIKIICITNRFDPIIKPRIYGNIYFIDNGSDFELLDKKVTSPSYFVLDEDMEITKFFTPSFNYVDLTNNYLNLISNM